MLKVVSEPKVGAALQIPGTQPEPLAFLEYDTMLLNLLFIYQATELVT